MEHELKELIKEEIKKAFIAIAKYFNNSILPTQENDYFRSRRHRFSSIPNAT
jgi:hypothetical protein